MIPGLGRSPWRRARQPTPVFWPGEPRGRRSLEGYSPWGHKELDTTERLHVHLPLWGGAVCLLVASPCLRHRHVEPGTRVCASVLQVRHPVWSCLCPQHAPRSLLRAGHSACVWMGGGSRVPREAGSNRNLTQKCLSWLCGCRRWAVNSG